MQDEATQINQMDQGLMLVPITFNKRGKLKTFAFGVRRSLFHLKFAFSRDSQRPIEECHLHLGVHKTATTYLQDQLERSQAELAGITYIPRKKLRLSVHNYGLHGAVKAIANKDKVILSDENFLGGTDSPLNGGVYFDFAERLTKCKKDINAKRLTVYLSLRNMMDFLSSSYCEHLRFNEFISFDEYTKAIDLESVSWNEVLRNVVEQNPDVEFRIFNFEQFSQDKRLLLEEISFGCLNQFDDDLPVSRASFTNGEIRQLSGTYDPSEPDNEMKFSPYSKAVKQASKIRLKEDLARLAEYPNVSIINE